MTDCVVVAVEVRQYLEPDGGQTIVAPTMIGETQHARAVKSTHAASLRARSGDEFAGETEAEVIRAVADWAAGQPDLRLAFGRAATRKWGSLRILLDTAPKVTPFMFWANGTAEMTFEYMISSTWQPFDRESLRLELQRRLNEIPGIRCARRAPCTPTEHPPHIDRRPHLEVFWT